MVKDIRTISLNILELTNKKSKILDELLDRCIEANNHLLETIDYLDVFNESKTRYSLQRVEYKHLKNGFGLHSQIIVDLCKDAFAVHKKNKNGFQLFYSLQCSKKCQSYQDQKWKPHYESRYIERKD